MKWKKKFEQVMIMLMQASPSSHGNNNGTQALDLAIPVNNQDGSIIGGRFGLEAGNFLNTVEKYVIATGKSFWLPGMTPRK